MSELVVLRSLLRRRRRRRRCRKRRRRTGFRRHSYARLLLAGWLAAAASVFANCGRGGGDGDRKRLVFSLPMLHL